MSEKLFVLAVDDWGGNCRGGPPWPPQDCHIVFSRRGGHGGPPLQLPYGILIVPVLLTRVWALMNTVVVPAGKLFGSLTTT